MHIAVIGGGFGGLLTAYLLSKKGIEVTVFEREERTGGHCMTIPDGNSGWELGTVCSYSEQIKKLLIELKVEYGEKFVYKHFVDDSFKRTEHLNHAEVRLLILELDTLKGIIETYKSSLQSPSFQHIHRDLLKPFDEFIRTWNLPVLRKFLLPFLTSFGFGDIQSVQAFYILRIFNLGLINSYLQGGKVIFFKRGVSDLVCRLRSKVRDIRYSHDVNRIEIGEGKVTVGTSGSSSRFDKVLITTKLQTGVIRTNPYCSLMEKIKTTPFFSCAFEVDDCEAVTTYYKGNQGKSGKIQLFRVSHTGNRKILVAYCNGSMNRTAIIGVREDIQALGINVRFLITAKQWHLFPHIKMEDLSPDLYGDFNNRTNDLPIQLIGSLITIPTLDNIYLSVKETVNGISNREKKPQNRHPHTSNI